MLAKILMEWNKIDPGAAEEMLRAQKEQGVPLGRQLLGKGILSDEEILKETARRFGLERISLKTEAVDEKAVESVPARVAYHYKLLPLGWKDGCLRVAMAYPPALWEKDEIGLVLRSSLEIVLAAEDDIERALRIHYGVGADIDVSEAASAVPRDEQIAAKDAAQAPAARLADALLAEARNSRATDVHLEPYRDGIRLRYRIDGVLYDARTSPALRQLRSALVSRLKVMARLSVTERRVPQDGRLRVELDGKEMDVRLSTLPTPFGESVVMRLPDGEKNLDLSQLGFSAEDQAALSNIMANPHGIVLLTGPTGSGKTTTLYSLLKRLNREDAKLVTLEDPIEHEMPGITQVQVNVKSGLTFAQGLRSLLRHDPDVMMVGEVRDLETAEIAVRVSLTGHLVLSTLHTNDAAGAVARLLDVGVEPYLAASSLRCLVAQRLVRVLCPECKERGAVAAEAAASFGVEPGLAGVDVFRPRGCASCRGTGFRGRTAIYEILPISEDIRRLVLARAPTPAVRRAAVARGMRPLRLCGWDKVVAGVTSPEEVLRVAPREDL